MNKTRSYSHRSNQWKKRRRKQWLFKIIYTINVIIFDSSTNIDHL